MFDAASTGGDGESELGQVERGYDQREDDQRALHARFMWRKRQQAAWDAEEARDLRTAERVRLWERYGCATFTEYLEIKCGIEPRTAIDRLRVAHALAELPLVEAELEAGTFAHSQVRELVRIVVPETEEEWVAHTRGMSYRQVRDALAGHVRGDRPGDPTRPDERLRTYRMQLTAQTAARLDALFAMLEAERGERFVDDDDKVNALCDAVASGGESEPAQVWLTEEGRGFANGVELDAPEVAALTCDATMMGRVDDSHARPVPAVSKRTRKRLMARDGNQCSVPGCRSKRHLDLHHIVPREDGGTNADKNLATICGGHHRLHHRGLLEIRGHAPDALEFRRHDPDEPGDDE